TMMAAVIGFFIGQAFDGSVAPLATGYTICGLAAIAIILLTERGRMFHPGAQGR
ncbi:MAG: MFS transporter, partial [Alphaproteobacteria bacterium]